MSTETVPFGGTPSTDRSVYRHGQTTVRVMSPERFAELPVRQRVAAARELAAVTVAAEFRAVKAAREARAARVEAAAEARRLRTVRAEAAVEAKLLALARAEVSAEAEVVAARLVAARERAARLRREGAEARRRERAVRGSVPSSVRREAERVRVYALVRWPEPVRVGAERLVLATDERCGVARGRDNTG